MAKAKRSKSIAIFLLFMMPAFCVLVTYAAYFKTINKKPICYNCIDETIASSNTKLLDTLQKIERYRQELIAEFNSLDKGRNIAVPLFRRQTQMDLAFLQEKVKSIYEKYYSENENHGEFNDLTALNNDSMNENNRLALAKSNVPITTFNRHQITKEINQFIFENSQVFVTGAGTNQLASSVISSAVIGKTYPNFSTNLKSSPLAYQGPVVPQSSNSNALATGAENSLFVVVPESELVNDPTIEYVPLSSSQYYMIFGLLTLMLIMKFKTDSETQPVH